MLKLGIRPALALLALGAALIVGGVALVYVPAALVLLGVAIVAGTLWGVEV